MNLAALDSRPASLAQTTTAHTAFKTCWHTLLCALLEVDLHHSLHHFHLPNTISKPRPSKPVTVFGLCQTEHSPRPSPLSTDTVPCVSLKTRQHGQEGQGNRKLWCVGPVSSEPGQGESAEVGSYLADHCVLQVSVATRRTHCAVAADAALTTSRRAHVPAAATPLLGSVHVSTYRVHQLIAASAVAAGSPKSKAAAAAVTAVAEQCLCGSSV